MKSIEVFSLTKSFDSFIAVNKVTFSVTKSEIFGLLGPNGAGKTTIIRMLCGILKPSAGEGTVGDFDIIRENEKIKQHIGYMSQKFSLYRDLTASENIDFFAGLYRIPNQEKIRRKSWALEIAGLVDFKNRLTHELPAGFRQRLALVCALIHKPSIIFLDEPTAGLDPISRRQFWDLIYQLKTEEKTTVFVTTHYMDEAEHCERIALIQDGSIVAIGSPAELKQLIKTKIMLLQGSPFFTIKEAVAKQEGVIDIVPFGLALHLFLEDEKYVEIIKKLLGKMDVQVTRFDPIIPSLEDVFVALMKK